MKCRKKLLTNSFKMTKRKKQQNDITYSVIRLKYKHEAVKWYVTINIVYYSLCIKVRLKKNYIMLKAKVNYFLYVGELKFKF